MARLHDANAILTEQVTEAERDHDALLESCGGVIDVLSPVGVSVEERLGNVPRWFTEVIQLVIRRGATLALVAATLRSGEDLHDMAIEFPPVEEPDDVGALAVEFRGAVGAIAESERAEDVIRSTPHDV